MVVLLTAAKTRDGRVFGVERSIAKGFQGLRSAANIPDIRFHDLRHTFATRLAQRGMPLHEIGRLLGHNLINTTYRYANSDDSTFERALAIVDESNANQGEIHPPLLVIN